MVAPAPAAQATTSPEHVVIREEDLILLSAWQETRENGVAAPQLARAAAAVAPAVRERFEKLSAGVHVST